VSKRPQCPKSRVLLAEAECGVAGVPVAVQPVPKQPNLVAAIVEKRDKQVAAAVLHDRTPQEHRLAREQLAEHGDTLLLNGEPILQVQAGGESVAFLQVLVDGVALHRATLLVVVEPLFNPLKQVVFSGSREFQLGVHHLLHPVGIARFDGAVHADEEVQHGFGRGLGNDRGLNDEFTTQKLQSTVLTTKVLDDGVELTGGQVLGREVHFRFHNSFSPWANLPIFVSLSSEQEPDQNGHSQKIPNNWDLVAMTIFSK